jgi:presenilin-like A22 family membrane protease
VACTNKASASVTIFNLSEEPTSQEIIENNELISKYQQEENLREAFAMIIENTNSIKEYLILIRHSQKKIRIFRLLFYIFLYIEIFYS